MRLLSYDETGSLSLTNYSSGTNIPPYAILSHTWGSEEVTYKELERGIDRHKRGYEKIRFCGKQARRDGLRHFWVDTCCIDKSSSAELTESINSMFRWYRDANKCYVYLEDVSSPTMQDYDRYNDEDWRLQFEKSRWFTRGWTLQELIAPKTVDFYSWDGVRLGNRESLEPLICGITGIPVQALRGSSLSRFTTSERLAWAEGRKTTVPEDKAYSMLGIFGIHMPLIYGEGRKRALKRLDEEILKDQKGSHYEEFSVPFSLHAVPEIEHFVAREQELAEMHEALRSDGRRRAVVLHGLGGMGKTQLAIEYAKRHKDNYSAIFWINIKDQSSLKQSFARIAHQITRHSPSARCVSRVKIRSNLDETIDAVKAWLSLPGNTRWLLVYDNYDNPKLSDNTDSAAVDVQQYLPEAYQGSVVITTRSSRVKVGHTIRIEKIQSLENSLEILSATSKREGLSDDHYAVDLAKELDGLPLALATAGAYIEQTSTTFRSYRRLYRDSWARLQAHSPKLHSYEDQTLYSTWQLSFDQVRRRNAHAAELLRLWAYFDNQDLWLELLQSYKDHSIEWIHQITKDELSFNYMVQTLSDYGLVETHSSVDELVESRGYSVHSCVHSWMVHVLNKEQSIDLARFAIMCIASHVPSRESGKWWLTQRRLLQHAGKYNKRILDEIMGNDMSWVYHGLGYLYHHNGKLKKAEKMYRRALQVDGKTLGPYHKSILSTMTNLGTLYAEQGRLKEAEEIHLRALQGKRKTLGPNHELTLDITGNLGLVYFEQGRIKEAEEVTQQVLRGCKNAFGSDHAKTLKTAYSLGRVYLFQDKLKEAEEMMQQALRGCKSTFGPNHTLTLDIVYALGFVYLDQGKLKEAEEMMQRVLRGSKAFGPYYKLTFDAVHVIGTICSDQGRLRTAEKMYQRALRGYKTALGPAHISTFTPITSLGSLYFDQGRLEEAEEMFRRALQGYQAAYGSNHPGTRGVLRNIRELQAYKGALI
ncbi:hypothetical protein F5Y10DRAFT_45733 [Nemania abortiva]|nr:hypothetical protein F5Y10DRAFT_45733 [Nemania abortiva]